MPDVDFTDRSTKLRAIWQRARNTYNTFYSELKIARDEIGDDVKFADFCFYELKISVSVLSNISIVLRKADAARIKQELIVVKRLAAAETKAKREVERAEKERHLAAKTADQKRQDTNRKQQERRARIKDEAAVKMIRVSDNAELAELIVEARRVDKTSRVECGRIYAKLKAEVQAGRAGKDEFGKAWKWTRWAQLHIDRSVNDVTKCIVEFHSSMSENHPIENVLLFPNSA